MRSLWVFLAAVGVTLAAVAKGGMAGEEISSRDVTFSGHLKGPNDLSGIARIGQSLLAVCSDEVGQIDILSRTANNTYAVSHSIELHDLEGELDLEGLAAEDNTLYAIASHSLVRLKPSADLTREENIELMAQVQHSRARDQLFRLRLDGHGNLQSGESINLRKLLKGDELLEEFTRIPGKENGVDMEGVAVRNGRIYVGFRGPVLRESYVPIMVLRFDDPTAYDLRFVQLNGLGIRDLTAVRDGFLILAGPVGDGGGDDTNQVYFWNGRDTLPALDQNPGTIVNLGQVPENGAGKAEGITVVEESAKGYQVIVIYDGVARGGPKLLNIPKP